jgi:hypothetical protein
MDGRAAAAPLELNLMERSGRIGTTRIANSGPTRADSLQRLETTGEQAGHWHACIFIAESCYCEMTMADVLLTTGAKLENRGIPKFAL